MASVLRQAWIVATVAMVITAIARGADGSISGFALAFAIVLTMMWPLLGLSFALVALALGEWLVGVLGAVLVALIPLTRALKNQEREPTFEPQELVRYVDELPIALQAELTREAGPSIETATLIEMANRSQPSEWEEVRRKLDPDGFDGPTLTTRSGQKVSQFAAEAIALAVRGGDRLSLGLDVDYMARWALVVPDSQARRATQASEVRHLMARTGADEVMLSRLLAEFTITGAGADVWRRSENVDALPDLDSQQRFDVTTTNRWKWRVRHWLGVDSGLSDSD